MSVIRLIFKCREKKGILPLLYLVLRKKHMVIREMIYGLFINFNKLMGFKNECFHLGLHTTKGHSKIINLLLHGARE